MKIAVCISGLARTYDATFKNFKNNVCHNDCDVFISTWDEIDSDVSTESRVRAQKVRAQREFENELCNLYKPKTFVREPIFSLNQHKIDKYNTNKRTDTYVESVLYMFYKMWSVDKLRRRFEEDFNFKYDVVVRTRFDLEIPTRLDYNLNGCDIMLPSMWRTTCNQFGLDWYNDTFAYGTSDAMATYSDIYLQIDQLFEKVPFQPEIMLYHWLQMNNLQVGHTNFKPSIIRPT